MTTSQQPGDDAEEYFDSAMDRARAGDLESAARLFRQASDRGHARAAYMLALLLKDQGQLTEAEVHYRRALYSSDLPAEVLADAHTGLGYIRAQAGDDQDAERLYRVADRYGSLDATFNLGVLLCRTGREQEGIDVYRRAATAGQPDAAYNLANILTDQGSLDEAEPLLRLAVAAGITEAINNLAQVRLRRGDTVEAEALLRQAVMAGDQNAIFNLGIVLQTRGALEEAETWLRRAQEAGHPEAAQHLARLPMSRVLADPAWLTPLTTAGFTPSNADLLRILERVLVAAPHYKNTFSDGMPFLSAPTAILVVQDRAIGLAVPDKTRILVIQRTVDGARLMVTRSKALQVVWGDATIDGWTFLDHKVDTPKGQELGETLNRWIRG